MKIRFLGADKIVTGSCHMLEVNGKKILLDCGMFQGSKLIRDLNRREFDFNPGEIDAVVLSHAHVDHSGLLPKLVKEGYKGPIYCTHVTKELCEILLPDCGHIQEQDAEIATRKGLRAGRTEVKPLYTVDDAYLALKQFVTYDYDENVEILPGVTIRFRVAGHILGSALVNVMINENGKETKIIFTGDIGQPNVPILDDPYQISGADFIITESTYGNRLHEIGDREKELLDIMKEALARGGNVIIPAFAVGRTQVMLYYFQKLMSSGQLPTVPIMVDSPMAIKATQVMLVNPDEYDEEAKTIFQRQGGKLINMKNVHYTETAQESRAINEMPSPMIIISASGMADAGRVLHHLKHNLWRKDSSVIFAGYQAEGSLGRRLIDGARKVKIMGEDIVVGAKIYNMTGFSAHADRDQMLKLYKGMKKKPKAFFVVHGEYDATRSFADTLRTELGTAAYVPNYGDTAIIEGTEWHVEPAKVVLKEPALQELTEALRGLEKFYFNYKARVLRRVMRDVTKVPEMKAKIEKIKKYVEDIMKNV
jgi:metallo-beta-lactamase family protein